MAFEKYHVVGDMLCEWVDHCTCGVPPHGHYGAHEPGCGLDPIGPVEQLVTPITAEDVRAAEQAWNEDRYAKGWPFRADLPMVRAAFIADHLNRRATPPPSDSPDDQVAGIDELEKER